MRRREFIGGLAGAAAVPLMAGAQQADRMRRIGILTPEAENDPQTQSNISAFLQGLRGLGWIDGRNVSISFRYAGGVGDPLRTAAKEIVALAPDAIIVVSNPAVVLLQQLNRAIPTVFVEVGDPVGSGFVDSLARPGGRLTGFATSEITMGGKWVELLKATSPHLTRALVFFDPEIVANLAYLRAIESAASINGITVSAVGVRGVDEIEPEVAAFATGANGGLVVVPSPITGNNRKLIAELATHHRLPSIGAFRYLAESGFLVSYGPDALDLFRRAAPYVDRILKGEKPGDLPVQQPVKFELVVNARTARAIGLTLSESFMLRADGVIE
jgi:putative tryptophan/tyrosine transport system substrate-binding protein